MSLDSFAGVRLTTDCTHLCYNYDFPSVPTLDFLRQRLQGAQFFTLFPLNLPPEIPRCSFTNICRELEQKLGGIPGVLTVGTHILVYGCEFKEAMSSMDLALKKFIETGLKIHPGKSQIFRKNVKAFGYNFSAAGVFLESDAEITTLEISNDVANESASAIEAVAEDTNDPATEGSRTDGSAADYAAASSDVSPIDVTTKDVATTEKEAATRSCAYPFCDKMEMRSLKLRCCRKCIDENIPIRHFYCGKECQTADWSLRHRSFHKDERKKR